MARRIHPRFWAQFKADAGIALSDRPTIVESDQWDDWMKVGTWLAVKGEDFTGSTEEFQEEVWRRAHVAKLDVDVVCGPPGQVSEQVIFRFRKFLKPEGKAPDSSKPMPAQDEETGEYLGYWWFPDGTWIPIPVTWYPRVTDDAA